MKAKGRRMLSLDQWQTFSQPEAVSSTGRVDRSGVIVEAGKNQPACEVSSSISPTVLRYFTEKMRSKSSTFLRASRRRETPPQGSSKASCLFANHSWRCTFSKSKFRERVLLQLSYTSLVLIDFEHLSLIVPIRS